ncbi:MAG: histidine--tRNA ligase [Anaerolineaceae bacterium]|nr:histidine--tRNA ligase [Anaerolineaceae bacterium]
MTNIKNIPTHVLPGFMELLPADQIVFERMKASIRASYEQFGFVPLETPIIERSEVLLSKAGGETERQIYRFTRGDNDLALRFDLTVPLARYVSEHFNELTFPFRRYHIGTVYRGERPQKGRFREFYQADIDIIGHNELSLVNDAEILSVIYTTFTHLGYHDFTVRINNRKVLNGLMASLGIETLTTDVLREIDKLEKIGAEAVRRDLLALGAPDAAVGRILEFAAIHGDPGEVLAGLRSLGIETDIFATGVDELAEVTRLVAYLGVPARNFTIDLSIARGLDYYTGTVYETILNDHPEIGSICSGGRYDNLAGQFTEQRLPGVGISIGLTRLYDQLKAVGLIHTGASTVTRVLVAPMIADLKVPLELAAKLREAGVPTEVYFSETRLKKKLTYASRLGIPYVAIIGEDEITAGVYALKDMSSGEQVKVGFEKLLEIVKEG